MSHWLRSLLVMLLVCLLSKLAVAAPQTNSPLFQAALAGLLETTEAPNDTEKLKRFDELVSMIQQSFHPDRPSVFVRDFEEYLQLRNHSFQTPKNASEYYTAKGVITPLNIRSGNSELIERIIAFELQELSSNPILAEQNSKHGELIKRLTDVYLSSLQARETLDKKSQQWIDKSFDAAEKFRQQKNPLGFLALAVGTGLSVARGIGENVVNPVASSVLYSESLQKTLRQKAYQEISKVLAWPEQQKIAVINEFERTVSTTLTKKFSELSVSTKSLASSSLKASLPQMNELLAAIMETYFENLSARQKKFLVWTVATDYGFLKRTPLDQAHIALGAIGPLLPFLLKEITKVQGVQLPQSLRAPLQSTSEEWRNQLEIELRQNGYTLEKFHPTPLAITPLKETFLIEVKSSAGVQKLVVQTASRIARDTLADDQKLFHNLAASREVNRRWQEAGLPDLRSLMQTFLGMINRELNFREVAAAQDQARKAFQNRADKVIAGRAWNIELSVPKSISVSKNESKFFLQEFAEGQTIEEARKNHPELVAAALEVFGETYLKNAFSKNSLIWSEPHGSNLRVQISPEKSQMKISFINMEKSDTLTQAELKAFYANIARLPLLELKKATAGGNIGPEQASELLGVLTRSGFQVSETVIKFAMGFLHLRNLVGADKFKVLLVRAIVSNPSIVWNVLGEKLRLYLETFYKRAEVKTSASSPQIARPATAATGRAFRCEGLF